MLDAFACFVRDVLCDVVWFVVLCDVVLCVVVWCSLRVCIWLVINDAMLCGVFFVLLCLNV